MFSMGSDDMKSCLFSPRFCRGMSTIGVFTFQSSSDSIASGVGSTSISPGAMSVSGSVMGGGSIKIWEEELCIGGINE